MRPISTSSLSTTELARHRRAFWIALFLVIATFIVVVSTWLVPAPTGVDPLSLGLTLLVLITSGVGAGLSWVGRASRGMGVLLVGMWVGVLASQWLTQGLGIVIGLTTFLISSTIGAVTLPAAYVRRTILAGLGVGILAILFDLLGPADRPTGGNADVINVVAVGLSVIYAVFVTRQFNQYPFRLKLLLTLLGVALLPVIGLGYLQDRATRQLLTTDANQNLLAAASQTAATLDDFFVRTQTAIETESSSPTLILYLSLSATERRGTTLAAESLAILKALRSRDVKSILSYAVLDRTGVVILDTDAAGLDQAETERAAFQVPFETGENYISPIYFLPGTETAVIDFSSPVRDATQRILGVLRVRYNAQIVQNLVVQAAAAQGGPTFAVVVDEYLLRVAHSSAPDLLFRAIAPITEAQWAELNAQNRLGPRPLEELATNLDEFAKALQTASVQPYFAGEAGEGDEPETEDTDVEQAAITSLTTQPWQVVFVTEQAAFLAPAAEQTRRTVLLSLLVAGLVALAAVGLTQILTAPVLRLTQVAAQIQAGNLQARAQIEAEDEIGTLAETFNAMTAQLRETLAGLEARINDRVRALAASAEVSRRLSTILDQRELILEVVQQIQSAFNYYHVHIYLFDAPRENLVLMGGTGEAGQIMLARQHRLAKGRGLVGRAADTNAPVVVLDVSQADGWLPNPLLPETRAEIAVPIAIGGRVVGVLDVQHNLAQGLTQDDAELLQSIANQIAIALQNARAYQQTQRQADLEILVNTISQKIQATNTVEAALQVAVRELGRATGARQAQVRLMPEARLHAEAVSHTGPLTLPSSSD